LVSDLSIRTTPGSFILAAPFARLALPLLEAACWHQSHARQRETLPGAFGGVVIVAGGEGAVEISGKLLSVDRRDRVTQFNPPFVATKRALGGRIREERGYMKIG
jgi:hypothetical protein